MKIVDEKIYIFPFDIAETYNIYYSCLYENKIWVFIGNKYRNIEYSIGLKPSYDTNWFVLCDYSKKEEPKQLEFDF